MWLPSPRCLFFLPKPQRSHLRQEEGRKKQQYGKRLQSDSIHCRLFEHHERPPNFSIEQRHVQAVPTEDGGMPVDAADPLVLGVLLVCEGLIEHQAVRDLTRPVASFHLDSQKFPVVIKHIHDLSLLKGLDNPAEVKIPTAMQIYCLLFMKHKVFLAMRSPCIAGKSIFTWGSSRGKTSSDSAPAGDFLSL